MNKQCHIALKVLKDEALQERQLVYGEVYIPNVPDSENDFMDEDGVTEMAHNFMRSMRLNKCDVQHDNNCVEGVHVVESFVARKNDPDFFPGAWVVGMHIPDTELWGRIKRGEINGFSMEAMVKRIPVEIEMEIPEVILGTTSKAEGEDHTHEFSVSYTPDGAFVGGRTNEVDGHFHVIRGGSVTEETNGHTHRYDFIDALMKQRWT